MKFGRRYRLTIQTDAGQLIIEPPFTIRFSLRRSVLASMNTLDIDIYNLSQTTRDNIFQDMFYKASPNRSIIFEAGYDFLSTVFKGEFREANSGREGVDIVTSITAFDGYFATQNTFSYRTLEPTTLREVIKDLIGSFDPERLTEGLVSDGASMSESFQRPIVLRGNTYEQLKKYSGGKAFIDLEKIYVLQDNEVIAGAIPLINADTGLLSTPRRDEAYLTVSTLFEPRIVMGQSLDLVSSVNPIYNGKYKAVGVQHSGIISEAVNGDCRTIVHLSDPIKFNGSIVNVS